MEVIQIIGVILLLAGLVLIGVEISMPGFGVPGITGIIGVALGIVLTATSIEQGLVLAIIVVVVVAVMFTVSLAYLSSKKHKTPVVLDEEVKFEDGMLNPSDLEYLIGKEGVAVSELRPAGKGRFNEVVFDILSEGTWISRGSRIRIVKIRENHLIVKEI